MQYKIFLAAFLLTCLPHVTFAKTTTIGSFRAHPPIHIFKSGGTASGVSPAMIKNLYHLPQTGGHGTIAIIAAYNDKHIEQDLAVFDKQYNLADCTVANGCLEKHLLDSGTSDNSGWDMETSLDVEWAHAIAPQAKILLVGAKTPSGTNLLDAVDYVRQRPDVVAITMSWGAPEFASETSLDVHFTSKFGATFFASSGDNGAGVSWPAVSPHVVAVGGTSINLPTNKETAWSGSGGGISKYELQPDFQKNYTIPKSGGMRAIPDVSYDADPSSGFGIYKSSLSGKGAWYVVGGTSAGSPQWAAIKSLGLSADNSKFYADKATGTGYFHDIIAGSNGECTYYCEARKHYDYVTGLGSPLTFKF